MEERELSHTLRDPPRKSGRLHLYLEPAQSSLDSPCRRRTGSPLPRLRQFRIRSKFFTHGLGICVRAIDKSTDQPWATGAADLNGTVGGIEATRPSAGALLPAIGSVWSAADLHVHPTQKSDFPAGNFPGCQETPQDAAGRNPKRSYRNTCGHSSLVHSNIAAEVVGTMGNGATGASCNPYRAIAIGGLSVASDW